MKKIKLDKDSMGKLFLTKGQIFLYLIILFQSCKYNLYKPDSSSNKEEIVCVADSITPDDSDQVDQNKRLYAIDQIDSYIDKQRQIVLETKPSEVYTINIPSDLLVLLDEGDLWRIDMYYLGELSSSKRKVLFEDAEYGYSQYSPHGNQRLLIYNDQNQLEGLCTMYMLDIPKIVRGDFIELKSESDCNKTTTLNLKDSIPNEIFIK